MKIIASKLKNQLSAFGVLLMVFILVSGADKAGAQTRHLTAQTIGLGGGGTAYQDLYHANFVNPANLMINHGSRPDFTVGIAGGIYSNAGGSLVNISAYNDYLTSGLIIEGAVADQMLDQWFGTESSGNRHLNLDVGVVPLGVTYRNNDWSVSAVSRARVLGNSSYSRGFADLVFRGLDSDHFSEARAVNTSQEFLIYNEISIGFATTVIELDNMFGFAENVRLHVGIAPKLLMAVNYARFNLESTLRVQNANSSQNAEIDHNFYYRFDLAGDFSDQIFEYNSQNKNGGDSSFSDYSKPTGNDFTTFKGTSVGLDFGATLEMDINSISAFDFGFFRGEKKLRVGLSLTDLGSVSINDRARSFIADDNLLWRGIEYDKNLIEDEFDGEDERYFESVLRDSIGSEVYGNFTTRNHSKFSRSLPAMLNVGSQLKLGKFGIMMDLGTGFIENGTNSRRSHLAMGTEYRVINRIPVRFGFRTGVHSSTTYHAGTGIELRNFEFSFGAATSASSGNNGAGIGAAWSGLVIHF